MSEENKEIEEVKETVTTPEGEGESSITTLEDALKVVEKLRRENASKRVKAKETEEAAKKWQEYVESQKTDLEKLTESKADLEKQLSELKLESVRKDIVSEFKVDKELVPFLTATDEEGLREQAKKLATAKPPSDGKPADFFAGQRGNQVKKPADTLNEWFADFWHSNENASNKRTFG